MTITIRCARGTAADCLVSYEADENELTGGGGAPSGLSLLHVLAAPEGWINDPDGDGCICGNCATPEEIAEHMEGLGLAEEGTDDPEAP